MPYAGAAEVDFRNLKKPIPDAITQEEIWELGQEMPDEQDRVLLYTLYLAGPRISEALWIQSRDIYLTEIGLPTGKTVQVVAIDLRTLKKRRGIPRRTIYVNLVGLDLKMFEVINAWRDRLPLADSYLFYYGDITLNTKKARDVAYQHLRKVKYVVKGLAPPDGKMIMLNNFHLYNHYLRHCRAHHLKTTYNLSGEEAMAFFGWSSSSLWARYGHQTARDVLARQIAKDGAIRAIPINSAEIT